MKIVFFGTPDFAVPSIEAIYNSKHQLLAVVTTPDKEAGRGKKIQQSDVKKCAINLGLTVLQPEKLRDPSFLEKLDELNADLYVIIAFRMLPEMVWNKPPLGSVNLHASLLPNYRGAAPIHHAVMNGEEKSGLTIFFLRHQIDTGDILLQKEIEIGLYESTGEVYEKMSREGAPLVVEALNIIEKGDYKLKPQQKEKGTKNAPKIFKNDCLINWNKTVDEVHNFIRGLSPFPCAFTLIGDKMLKIFSVEKEYSSDIESIGKFISDGKSYLKVSVQNGYIHLKDIQLQGKKKLGIVEFIRGFDTTTLN